MRKSAINNEERQRRLLLLQEFEQWRGDTESASCKDRNVIVANIGPRPKEFPTLVAVTKKPGPIKQASSAAKTAIRIRLSASSIDIAGDIAPTLLAQLLSTLEALDVL